MSFQTILLTFPCIFVDGPSTPDGASTPPVWALARSLATTCAITFVFSSYGYLDVSVPRVRLLDRMTGLPPAGLPHSDIRGSRVICTSPRLFAAYHVLHRLREPRHPPSALAYFLLPSRPLQTVSGSIFLQLALLFLFFLVVQHVKDLFCLPPDCSGFQLNVENNGFEPLTLCVQSRCSSQLS